ncbi:MAG: DUF3786 domain-containing protein [Deltaproteobacteria bacterium]|nr:DUF3786 domain-containing protein [Deltaproteobacteria bacterium]
MAASSVEKPTIVFPQVLWDDLAKVDPNLAADIAGAKYVGGRFTVDFLGAPHVVDPSARLVTSPANRLKADFQKALVLLVYLAQAGRGQPYAPAGRLVGPNEIPGGTMFFRGPHKLPTAPLEEAYAASPETLAAKAVSLGAFEAPPALFRWQVLPHIEIACYFDPQDDEFPAQARYAFDANSHLVLPLDALWALINVVASELLPHE